MSMDAEYYLKRFYDKLYENLLFENKLKKESILISFLELKSNSRYTFLESAAISEEKIPEIILLDLKRNNLVRPSDEVNKYTITGKGVWKVEKNRKRVTEDIIVDYLDKKKFDFYSSNKKLSDKEKIILFSMISARTFSEESPIDLKKDEYTLNAWKRIIYESYSKLNELKLVKKLSEEQLYGKKGNEHKVSNLIRHTDSLPKKTKATFKAKGKQKYFLDIFFKNSLSKEKLTHIVNIIFNLDKNNSTELVEEINDFCLKIAYEEAPYIYDLENHLFSSPEYDDIVKDAIREAILLK